VQVGASRPGTLRRNRGRCRSARRYRTQRFVVALGQLQEPCHDPAQVLAHAADNDGAGAAAGQPRDRRFELSQTVEERLVAPASIRPAHLRLLQLSCFAQILPENNNGQLIAAPLCTSCRELPQMVRMGRCLKVLNRQKPPGSHSAFARSEQSTEPGQTSTTSLARVPSAVEHLFSWSKGWRGYRSSSSPCRVTTSKASPVNCKMVRPEPARSIL
jgi:hypothetical protein